MHRCSECGQRPQRIHVLRIWMGYDVAGFRARVKCECGYCGPEVERADRTTAVRVAAGKWNERVSRERLVWFVDSGRLIRLESEPQVIEVKIQFA